jgi:glycosyltransferase involved in cell wall biosynthesis
LPRSTASPAQSSKASCFRHLAHVFEQAGRFDLIHNQADFPAHGFARLTSTAMVTTIHGFSSDRILPMYLPYQDRVHFVAISAADRHPALRYAATIHHGIRMDEFPFDPAGSEDLLFFGRIHHDKGVSEAIAAARASGRTLHLYGVVQDEDYYQRELMPANDGQTIRYHGPVGGAARLRALGAARALLHLINFDEPFGLAVIEAMACGTPVVAFNRGSMPELIEHGVTGFLVDTVDEAVRAIERIGEIDRGEVRRLVRQRFTVERMADAYIELYRRILADRDR